jgi:hypothetical protein
MAGIRIFRRGYDQGDAIRVHFQGVRLRTIQVHYHPGNQGFGAMQADTNIADTAVTHSNPFLLC